MKASAKRVDVTTMMATGTGTAIVSRLCLRLLQLHQPRSLNAPSTTTVRANPSAWSLVVGKAPAPFVPPSTHLSGQDGGVSALETGLAEYSSRILRTSPSGPSSDFLLFSLRFFHWIGGLPACMKGRRQIPTASDGRVLFFLSFFASGA